MSNSPCGLFLNRYSASILRAREARIRKNSSLLRQFSEVRALARALCLSLLSSRCSNILAVSIKSSGTSIPHFFLKYLGIGLAVPSKGTKPSSLIRSSEVKNLLAQDLEKHIEKVELNHLNDKNPHLFQITFLNITGNITHTICIGDINRIM